MKKILSLIVLFSFPLREAIGINVGIPIRFGELAMYLYAAYTIITIYKNKIFKSGYFYKKALILCILLLINLLICSVVSLNSSVNNEFLVKYIFRNSCILLFIFSIMINPIKIEQKNYECFFKYIIIVELIFCLLQILGKDIYFLNLVDYNPQKYFGLTRLKGTASEPGYLPVVIAPALYYFRNKNYNKKYYWIGILIIFFTFSSFAYLVIGFEILYYIKKLLNNKEFNMKKIIKLSLILSIVICIIYPLSYGLKNTDINEAIRFNVKKISNFIKADQVDYSSESRIQQMKLALDKFNEFNYFNRFLGEGTGAYSKYMNSVGNNMVLEAADEAHNLYVSTLYDRGLIGEVILIITIFVILGLANKNKSTIFTKSMKYSIYIQIIHWMLTGNLWLYYFWIDVGILISNDIVKIRKDNIVDI